MLHMFVFKLVAMVAHTHIHTHTHAIMAFSSSSSQDNILGIMESLLVCLKWCKEKVEQEKGTVHLILTVTAHSPVFSSLIHSRSHYRQKQQGSALPSFSPLQDAAVNTKNVL